MAAGPAVGAPVMGQILVPLVMALVSVAALARRQDVYGAMTEGGAKGLRTLVSIVPALVALLAAVEMLRASGLLDALAAAAAPLFQRFGIPPETAPLVLIRPISGSAALAVGADLMAVYGPDSEIGRTAAIMLGSTETTFYTISVYFGAAGIRRSRYAIPAALVADLVGFAAAAWSAKLFF